MKRQALEADTPWKEALEHYFEPFMALFHPEAHVEIDWSRPCVFLDKELQQVVRDADAGRALADKLVQVWRLDGEEEWVMVHVEVQGKEVPDFADRMYRYHYRLYDRYQRQVASLAVLTDTRENWRPPPFRRGLWSCRLLFEYPMVKLLDFQGREAELKASDNPFAIVVRAHLSALATRANPVARKEQKLQLAAELYERGYSRKDVLELFRFIDWLLRLPPRLDEQFWQSLTEFEEKRRMPYVTSVERRALERGRNEGHKKGREEGREEGRVEGRAEGRVEGRVEGRGEGASAAMRRAVLQVLEARLGAVPEQVRELVEAEGELERLNRLPPIAATVESWGEFVRLAGPG
jgi:hypothetical protein